MALAMIHCFMTSLLRKSNAANSGYATSLAMAQGQAIDWTQLA